MKDQYLLLVFAFAFMAAYRLTISMNLRAILQMSLFAIPLTALISQGEEGVTPWAYACLGVAVVWWFADLFTIFRTARIAYLGQQRVRIAKATRQPQTRRMSESTHEIARTANPGPATTHAQKPVDAPEKVEMVSLKPSDIHYGPVIGLMNDKPIYEWISAHGRSGRAEYVGMLGQGVNLEDNDLMLAPGLIYRWMEAQKASQHEEALEAV